MTYKRPSFRAHGCYASTPLRCGNTGRAADVWAKRLVREVRREWAPPSDAEGYVRLLEMAGEPIGDFLVKTAAYYERHPPAEPREPPPPPPVIDADMAMECLPLRKTNMTRWLRSLKKAGWGNEAVMKAMETNQWRKDHDDELTAEITRRWGGSAPTKKIKAVKKKV
jgi:hypothetical protein